MSRVHKTHLSFYLRKFLRMFLVNRARFYGYEQGNVPDGGRGSNSFLQIYLGFAILSSCL